jgi:hypothetical protein
LLTGWLALGLRQAVRVVLAPLAAAIPPVDPDRPLDMDVRAVHASADRAVLAPLAAAIPPIDPTAPG